MRKLASTVGSLAVGVLMTAAGLHFDVYQLTIAGVILLGTAVVLWLVGWGHDNAADQTKQTGPTAHNQAIGHGTGTTIGQLNNYASNSTQVSFNVSHEGCVENNGLYGHFIRVDWHSPFPLRALKITRTDGKVARWGFMIEEGRSNVYFPESSIRKTADSVLFHIDPPPATIRMWTTEARTPRIKVEVG